MSTTSNDDLGKLILRLALGILILFHGASKLVHGIGWLPGMLQGHGLPGFLAYGVFIGEVLAPVLLILGVYTRLGALIVVVNMLFVFGLAHMPHFFELGDSGGWRLELQGMYLFSAIAVLLFGAGGYSLGGRHGRWN